MNNDCLKQISQNDLIRLISYNTSLTKKAVREVLDELENVITKEALLTTKESSVKIKLFKGFYVMAKYSDGHEYLKGATKGNNISPAPKIKLYVSDTYKSKIRNMYNS